MPRTSVVIPSYDSADTLPTAIDSVLSQTVDDLEVIVVDDASSDDTEAVVAEYDDDRIRFTAHETNRGGSAARNTGIELADGEYVAFLDADDEWYPRKLSRQIRALEGRPDEYVGAHCARSFDRSTAAQFGYSLARLVGARKSDPPEEGSDEVIRAVLLGHVSPGASTLLVESQTVSEMGGFDTSFPRHQDWEFLIRMCKHGEVAYVDEPLVVKHGTGRPDAKTYVEAKEKLLTTFADDVARYEAQGYPITHKQELYLAKLFLEDGTLIEGLRRLSPIELSGPELLSAAWSLALGVRERLG